MDKNKAPFNITILNLNKEKVKYLRPVQVTSINEGATTRFHPDGLYSNEIFGEVGTEERFMRFSYIDLKSEILHPTIYYAICKLRAFNKHIMDGTKYAIWNPKLKDFEPSNEVEGETGYAFFLRHWKDIKWTQNSSSRRQQRIELVEKYKELATTNRWVVIPAGLRDIRISDEDGSVKEEEINDFYRRLISVASNLTMAANDPDNQVYDGPRKALQKCINDIYDLIDTMLTGKKGALQAKWGSRRIFYGTSNVLSSLDLGVSDLMDEHSIRPTDTVVGLYQLAKGILPKTIHHLSVYPAIAKLADGSDVAMIEPKTYRSVRVDIDPKTKDRWSTPEGLEQVINYYGTGGVRNRQVTIEGKYLALIYTGTDGLRVLGDGEYEELTDERKELCRPITYQELIYIAGHEYWNKATAQITRYPITGINSTYPSTIHCKVTMERDTYNLLDREFNPTGEVVRDFPRQNSASFDTMSVNIGRLHGLGGDFDGDKGSANFQLSEEALNEVTSFLNSPDGYIDPTGGLYYTGSDTIDWALRALTYGARDL